MVAATIITNLRWLSFIHFCIFIASFPLPSHFPDQATVSSKPSQKIKLSTLLCPLSSFHHSTGSECSCLALIHVLKLFLPIFCTTAKVTAIFSDLHPSFARHSLKRDCHSEILAAAQTSYPLPQGSPQGCASSHPSDHHLFSCLLQPLPSSPCMKPCMLYCPTCSSQLCSFSYWRFKKRYPQSKQIIILLKKKHI